MRLLSNPAEMTLSSVGVPVSGDYALDSVRDNYPSHPYISDMHTDTITVGFDAGQDSLFLGHVMAEEVKVTFNTGEVESFPQRIGWNRVFARGRKKLGNDIWVDVPATATSADVELKNVVNVAEGIDTFSSNGTDGILKQGADQIIFEDYPQLKVGTFLVNGGMTYQIKELRGAGTGVDDVVLRTGGSAGFTISEVRLPLSIGLIRVGKKTQFPNPTVGLMMNTQDFGIRRESLGAMLYSPRSMVRAYSVPMQLTREQLDLFIVTTEGLRGTPVACDLLNGMDPRRVGYMTLVNPPDINAMVRLYSIFEVNFELRELS